MSYLQRLIELDKELLLALNGSDSLFWDGFLMVYTGMLIWIPIALILLYIIYKNKGLKNTLLIIVLIALVVTFADQISSSFFKPFFQRFRPTQDPEIMYLVDIVDGYRSGRYGFISSHAANSFGILTFLGLVIKIRELTYALTCWALINCFSRIYLGVHYFGDIFGGIILGCLVGLAIYQLYKLINNKYFPEKNYYFSNKYSKSGFLIADINTLLLVLFISFFLIVLIGMFQFI